MLTEIRDECLGTSWHRYEARFDEVKEGRKNNDEGLVEIHKKEYLFDICIKCGKIIKRKE